MSYFKYGDLVETTDGAYAGVVCPNPDGSDDLDKMVYISWKAAATRTGSATFRGDLLRLSDPLERRVRGTKAANPSHYKGNGVEVIDLIEGLELAFHAGNVVKYVARYKNKNGVEDLVKARWYLDRLIRLELDDLEDTDTSGDRTTPKRSGA